MLTFAIYLLTGLVTLLPVFWMMLGAWMGVPVVWSEYVAGIGSCLLIVAAYLSLFDRRTGTVFAAGGLLATVPFWIVEPIRALRVEAGSVANWIILLAYIAVAGVCGIRVQREFRRMGKDGVGQRGRRAVIGVTAVLFVCLLAAGQWQHVTSERHACRYILPDGYVGWVVIHFGHAGALPINLKDQSLVFDVPESGVLYTSSQQEFGEARDHYFYRLADGRLREIPNTGWEKGGMVWDESSGTTEKPGSPDDHTEQFFVGTEKQENEMQNLPNTWTGVVPGDLRGKLR